MPRDRITAIQRAAERVRDRMLRFLRELIAIPSPPAGEEAAVRRTAREMQDLGFDAVERDVLGSVVGTLGNGPFELLYDAHLDTVCLGDVRDWDCDPFLGRIDETHVYGLGASNNKGAMAAMLYAAHVLRELDLLQGVTLRVVGSIMEEECEGLCYRSLLQSGLVRPDLVVLGKCTDLGVCRGQRGRMECRGVVTGRSTHASRPGSEPNAAGAAAAILTRVQELNARLPEDPFLGKGSIAITHVETPRGRAFFTPASCELAIDRRLTKGESREEAIAQLLRLAPEGNLQVEVRRYDRPSYTGQILEVERFYPQWELPAEHAFVAAAVRTAAAVLGRTPDVKPWSFSTNGVYTMGIAGIPTVGFGPGREVQVHAVNDRVAIDELLQALAFYALFPATVVGTRGSGG
ncbi:MAG: YgeY family selenium metabolism-linked hydrolase [Planctomycetes bacterium]|nr:YgeY family selenium metabolism-linked hydrolase [Planctomycetota bacterium]